MRNVLRAVVAVWPELVALGSAGYALIVREMRAQELEGDLVRSSEALAAAGGEICALREKLREREAAEVQPCPAPQTP